ncbi:glycosyltransferase [Mangrovihabitans endophyticus]|uniref:Transferase n=1 Tax=Mangrovihabitans endophyticus TaxID=1751298 RepID=A0A8J3C537_9ACTN|nr:glycosyltransferase [Mangrovihabitans endophyticus]GGL10678.1 transferase [Mangrovihabitans endophyticus]
MRICLLTGDGPHRRDAYGEWCRPLVDGLGSHTVDLVDVGWDPPATTPACPPRVASTRTVTLSRPILDHDARRGHASRELTEAAEALCRGLIHGGSRFRDGLRHLALHAGPDGAALHGVPLARMLAAAWRDGGPAESAPLPRLGGRDARAGARLLRDTGRALAAELPPTDLLHCAGGTTPLLAALAAHWRDGAPLLLTDGCADPPGAPPASLRQSPAMDTLLRLLRRAVGDAGYATADLVASTSDVHRAHAVDRGTPTHRAITVPAGVDPARWPALPEPAPEPPALVWAGNGGPGSGLGPVLDAFAGVVTVLPDAVLHLVGVTADDEDHCAERVDRTGLGRAVRQYPLPLDPGERYAAGHVVVHVTGPADPAHGPVEAMMSGRAIAGFGSGAAGEVVGDAGVLVPPGDVAALTDACIALLRSPDRRRALADAARCRAMQRYTSDRMVRVYQALYTDLAGAPPAGRVEFELALPAPRSAGAPTIRHLVPEGR